eukprot:CAMPEP_0113884122 /NCGR_PEP_ID=MMETSP0780_2-20120614/10040_1 /TAXON_ID=652834 /ORGANISM="Palpitomonas bilix" /LENGTH=319 /DNA_ID=CAMNT_0000871623 /DNA_START=160 /DNA_END=1119 /DNA_ORIENTATION=- /assembly_acc=CAM_ASM_000599
MELALDVITEAFDVTLEESVDAPSVEHGLPAVIEAGLKALKNGEDRAPASHKLPADKTFEDFLELLKERNYFGDAQPGSEDYTQKMESAREKYEGRYGKAEETQDRQPTSAELSLAEQKKAEGNTALAEGKFNEAVGKYTEAIELNPSSAIYYCNRAAAYLRLRQPNEAVADCREGLKRDPTYVKGYNRLGSALCEIGKYQEAIDDGFQKALNIDPANQAAIDGLNKAKTMLPQTGGSQGAGAPGGNPLGGNMDLGALFNNPDLVNMAQQAMQNPALASMAQNLMQNPGALGGLANMFGSAFGGGAGGGGQGQGGEQQN